jgi:hypothetical protein
LPPPLISVCILAGHGVDALDACLASLRAQRSAPPFELLVGGRPTPEVVALLGRHFPDAHVCQTGRRLPGAARNPLIERARGELLLFLDDDVTAPPNLLAKLARAAASHPEASVFGGPNETPPHSTRFQVVQGAVLGSVTGSGPVCRRYGAHRAGPADERWFTLCNLAVRREAMRPFMHQLVCAEENALLATLRSGGARMRYEPGLRVFHDRRPSPGSFARQMLKYGHGRGQLLARRPGTLRAAYLAPSALLLYLLALAALLLAGAGSAPIVLPAAAYGLLVVATGIRIAWTLRRPSVAPLAAALTCTVHLVYGAGVLRGLLARTGVPAVEPERWTAPVPEIVASAPLD